MEHATLRDSAARARLVAVAADLFYRKGVPNVGINEIIDAAAIARMTLYHHFASKDDLVLAVLAQRCAERQQGFAGAITRPRTARAKVIAAFEHLANVAAHPGYRGCAFVNAAAERADPDNAVHQLVAGHKTWIAAQFEVIARAGKWPRPRLVAQQLLVLWDGAAVGAYLCGNVEPVVAARAAAISLMPATRRR
ncbi:MAG: TetR/AcrR family transcriptional regulator [Betaproteobacteria bacterium]